MAKRVYISLEANPLSVDVLVGDQLRSADFTGGLKHPIVLMPKFMTEDEGLQKALEAYPTYGVSFTRLLVEGSEDETIKKQFATAKEAKDWLNENKEIPYNKMTTKDKMIQVALEHGIEVELPTE